MICDIPIIYWDIPHLGQLSNNVQIHRILVAYRHFVSLKTNVCHVQFNSRIKQAGIFHTTTNEFGKFVVSAHTNGAAQVVIVSFGQSDLGSVTGLQL